MKMKIFYANKTLLWNTDVMSCSFRPFRDKIFIENRFSPNMGCPFRDKTLRFNL